MGRRAVVAVVGAAVVVVLAAGLVTLVGRDPPPLPVEETQAFAAALGRGHGPTSAATALIERIRDEAGITSTHVDVTRVRRRGRSGATAMLAVRHVVRGLGEWSYTTDVRFGRHDGKWIVEWSPAVLHPQLRADDRVTRTRTRPRRGTLLADDGSPLSAPASGLSTLGRVGVITLEQLAQLGPTYEAGDVVGRSGLEAAFEPQLAGTPSGTLAFDGPAGRHVVVHQVTGTPGTDVRTTLRPELQRAADRTIARVTQPSALVAVDIATGGIVAVANGPTGSSFDRALVGRYPPGSTFKVVTTEALLTDGRTPDSTVECEETARVGGKRFHNFEGEAFGRQTLRQAFAHSCNTAFVTEAATLTDAELVAAARRFGFDTPYRTGVSASHASFPTPHDAAERAAAAIGQGRVLVTPVHMASVIAAVADGTWRAPHLLADAPVADVPTAQPTPAALPALRSMLRDVIAYGTGTAARGVADLLGKTGTAEFGVGNPLPTHAWFIGVRHGIAFAVVVEGGGVGGRVAAPLAARFASLVG